MDNPIIRIAALVFAFLCTTESARAEIISASNDITAESSFSAYLRSDAHQKARGAVAATEDDATGRFCKDGYKMFPVAVIILSPVEIQEGRDLPTSGRWAERLRGQRCGEASLYTVLFTAYENGVTALPVAPGATELGVDLVRDLRPAIVPKAIAKNCEIKALFDTAPGIPAGYTPEQSDARYETWTVRACGALVDMVLRINTNDDGTVGVVVESQQERIVDPS